ncbi:MAG: NnrS family protein, partial [Magnetococcales bacterium]|nr:NnrS family protein [Magnetococcales bacterium]
MQKLFNGPFWSRGFRPFFFGGAIYAVLSILTWGMFYAGILEISSPFDSLVVWHAYEMIFGFAMAIVAGFLLTAVANWTGSSPVRRTHLFVLFLLWVSGRIFMNLSLGVPTWFIMFVELAFIPLLAISIAVPMFRMKNKRNFI